MVRDCNPNEKMGLGMIEQLLRTPVRLKWDE